MEMIMFDTKILNFKKGTQRGRALAPPGLISHIPLSVFFFI